jgi:hypothetical protein
MYQPPTLSALLYPQQPLGLRLSQRQKRPMPSIIHTHMGSAEVKLGYDVGVQRDIHVKTAAATF